MRAENAEQPIARGTFRKVMKMIAAARPWQRGVWWANINGWHWPREWPMPQSDLALVPKQQFDMIVAAVTARGGSDCGNVIWTRRAKRDVCPSTGRPFYAEFRYVDPPQPRRVSVPDSLRGNADALAEAALDARATQLTQRIDEALSAASPARSAATRDPEWRTG